MASVEGLLLALFTAGTVAGSLLPGGEHQQGGANHNTLDLSGGVFTKPGEPLQPFAPQRPPAPPPGRLPQLYFPPSTPGDAEIAIEPADEFTQLSSGPPVGIGGPSFVEPDFGGWIPMTSSPEHLSSSQTAGESFSPQPPPISQQLSEAGFAQGSSSFGQHSQLQPQIGSGDAGFSSFTTESLSTPTQEELLTNAWSQAPTAQSGGEQGDLPASYVTPSPESGSLPSDAETVSTDLKPLNLPAPAVPSSQSPLQSFGGNTGTFSSSFLSSSGAGSSFSGTQSIFTDVKPLGLPKPESVPSPFLLPNEGDNTSSFFSSNGQSLSGGGTSSSQVGNQVGGSSQLSVQSGNGNVNLPSSYVPPSSEASGSLPQISQVLTDLKPLGLPPPVNSPPQFISQTSSGGSTSLPPSYVPPLSGNIGPLAQTEGTVPIHLKPINLPQSGFVQPLAQTGGADTGSNLGGSTSQGGSSFTQSQQSTPTILKPLNIPQAGEQHSQTFLKPLDLPQTEPVQTFLKPLDLPQTEPVETFLKPLDLPQNKPVETFLKPLDLPQTEPVETFLKPLDLPQTEPVEAFLKPVDLPQTEPVHTFPKPLDLPQTEPVQTVLKPLDIPQTVSVETFLKPLDLPQTEPVETFLRPFPRTEPLQTFLKPLDLPQTESVDTFLKPLELPQIEPVQTSLKPLDRPQNEETLVPTVLKPLDTLHASGAPPHQTLQTDTEALAPSYVPPPAVGSTSLSQGGPISTGLKPLGLPQTSGVLFQSSSQSASQTDSVDSNDHSLPYQPLSLNGGDPFPLSSSVPTQLKPQGLPPPGEPAFQSQSTSQTRGESISYSPPPANFPSSLGESAGNFLSEGAGTGPDIAPTLLKPSGLPSIDGSFSESSTQFSTSGDSSSYNPAAQSSPQVVTSSGEFSSQFTSQHSDGGLPASGESYQPTSGDEEGSSVPGPAGASAGPLAVGGVTALLKPLDLPQQIAVGSEQSFVQPGFQFAESVDNTQPAFTSKPQAVDNTPLLSAVAPVDETIFSSQGGSIEAPGSARIQSLSESESAPGEDGRTGLTTVSGSAATGVSGALSTLQTSGPAYQPEIALGAAASGGVGSIAPFPQSPVQNQPLDLPQPPPGIELSSSGDSAGFGSPPSVVIDEQFLTGPSGGPSIISPPGIPAGVAGGGSGSGFGGGSSGGEDGNVNSFSGGSSSGGLSISGGGDTGGSGIGISSGLSSISSTASTGSSGGSGGPVEVLSQTFKIDENGNYEYSYEQSDGQAARESGQFIPGNEPETGTLASTGGYRYRGTDGRQYAVEYTADERGFLPTGDHLPRPPAQIAAYAELRERHPALFWAEKLRVRGPEE